MFLPFNFAIDHKGNKIKLASHQISQRVAVGILWRVPQFLLTSRPSGKLWANYWEFPGGKIELNETPLMALTRELQEELNITISQAQEWKYLDVSYPHAAVRLYLFKVTQWSGEILAQEQQQFQWCQFPLTLAPILPGTIPILQEMAKHLGSEN